MNPTSFLPDFPDYFNPALQDFFHLRQQAETQIQKGLETSLASTGYPMEKLYGGAKIDALLATIGGGSVNNGGQGMYGGLRMLMLYAWACGAGYGFQQGVEFRQLYW